MDNNSLNAKLKERRNKLIRRNLRYAKWQGRWAEIVTTLLFIYVALPFVAPTLMKLGATGPAGVIYTMYSPLCHQFAFRSMFLYGDQTFYPRAAAEYDALDSFDEVAAQSPTFVALYEERRRNELADNFGEDVAADYSFTGENELSDWSVPLTLAARAFRGDEQMGYKVTLCARDIAIYAAMAFAGILFLFVRKRIRPVPLVLYVLLGLGPIGLDGFSQLLSYPPFEFWDARETIPEFRVITGLLFGFMSAWLAFPYIERGMQESIDNIHATIAELEADNNKSAKKKKAKAK